MTEWNATIESAREQEREFDDQRKKHFTERVEKEKRLKTNDRKIRNKKGKRVGSPDMQWEWECEDIQTDG